MSTVGSVGQPINWPQFWQKFKQYALWDLEWFDGSEWISVKEDLAVQLSYPEPNRCKIKLVFDASHAGNYRLTHAINKVVREHFTRTDKYQYDLHYDDIFITFDWSDCAEIPGLKFTHGVKDDLFWFRIRRDNVPLGAHVEIDPATVATSTQYIAVTYGGFTREGFYSPAAELFFNFYSNGTNAGWEFSVDGTTWVGAFTSIGACSGYGNFCIWFDGTYVHYLRRASFDIFYRCGTPENDGSITWFAAETRMANGGSNNDDYKNPSITVDSDGYAWVGFVRNIDGVDTPHVRKNSRNDGTWALDFDYELSVVDDSNWRVAPIPLTDGKVYVVYCRTSQRPYGRLYDGGWGAEETNFTDYTIEDGYGFSAGAIVDNVHLVYNRNFTYQLRHNERVWGVGWNADDMLVHDPVTSSTSPALSVDPSTGDLYCFWALSTTDHVYYKQYTGGAWDGAATDWIDESTDGIPYDYLCSSFYMDYGGYIGLLYVTALGSPYNVRFAFLTMPPPIVEHFQTIEDILGMVESSPLVASLHLTASDQLGLLDTTLPRADFKQQVTDQLGMLDDTVTVKGLYQIIIESLGMTEAVAPRADLKAEAIESLSLLDTTEAQSALKQVVAEILGLLESTAPRSDQKQVITEQLEMLDAVALRSDYKQLIIDYLGMVDALEWPWPGVIMNILAKKLGLGVSGTTRGQTLTGKKRE